MVEKTSPFKDRLKEALKIRELRPVDLCNKTKISQSTMSQYLSGYAEPKKQRLSLIAETLRVNPAWLMGLDEPMDSNALSHNVKTSLHDFHISKGKKIIEGLNIKLIQLNEDGLNKVVEYSDLILNESKYRKQSASDIREKHQLNDTETASPNAALRRTDVKVTDEMQKHDDDIMDDDNF